MRSVLVVIALCLTVTVLADPIPCISLNGRAYVPMDQVGVIEAPSEYSRSMCDTDFVWVRTVAETFGGQLQWSGRQVELRDWDGHLLHSFLPLPPREFWSSAQVKDAYPDLIAAAAGRAAPHVEPSTQWQFKMAWARGAQQTGRAYSGALGQALAAEEARLRGSIGGGSQARINSIERRIQIRENYAAEQARKRVYGR